MNWLMDNAALLLGIAGMLTLSVIGVWDIVATTSGRPDATVSSLARGVAARHPLLPLTVGLVIGHLFW